MSQRSSNAKTPSTPGTAAPTGPKLQAVPAHPPLEFDAALAQVRAAYHRDLADATDESELQRAHDELLARDRKISGICTDLIDRRIRESQFINRVLRAYGHNPEE